MNGFYVTEDGYIMKGCGIESDSHGAFLENDYMRGYFVDPTPLEDYTRVWTEDGVPVRKGMTLYDADGKN